MNLPNRITLLRIALVPVFVGLCFAPAPWSTWVAMSVFILASLTDLVDGRLARAMGLVTDFGKFIDPIADKLLVNSAMIVLVGRGELHVIAAIIFIARELIVSGFRMVAAAKGQVLAADVWGKLKTVFQMILVCVLLVSNWPFSLIGFPMATLLLWISIALTVWSGIQYIAPNWQMVMEG